MSPNGLAGLVLGLALAAALSACAGRPHADLGALQQATVLIEHDKGHGTGTIVSPHQVLTAYHVVQTTPVQVTFFKGEARAGRISWSDPRLDLALVDVAVPDGYAVPQLWCTALHTGQHLVSIGHPIQARWVATGGDLPTTVGIGGSQLVPLGFPIGLGTSGGPVFDDAGRVVGVTLAILAERTSTSAGYERYKDTGIGLMLPIKDYCDRDTLGG